MAKGKKYKPGYYINDEEFTAELTKWAIKCREQKELGLEYPLTNYLGECILKIVDNLGTKGNFKNYTWLEDMKADAVINLVKLIHNYDPKHNDKGRGKGSAYIYVSFIAYQAFLRRIAKEKREQYYKYRNLLVIEDDPGVKKLIEESGQSDFHDKIAEYEESHEKQKEKQRINAEKRKPNPHQIFDQFGHEDTGKENTA